MICGSADPRFWRELPFNAPRATSGSQYLLQRSEGALDEYGTHSDFIVCNRLTVPEVACPFRNLDFCLVCESVRDRSHWP